MGDDDKEKEEDKDKDYEQSRVTWGGGGQRAAADASKAAQTKRAKIAALKDEAAVIAAAAVSVKAVAAIQPRGASAEAANCLQGLPIFEPPSVVSIFLCMICFIWIDCY